MKSQNPEPAGRRLTPAEEKQLPDMLDGGKTALKISRKLRRIFQAIYARLQRAYRPLREDRVEMPKAKGEWR
jgi:hypothetical protein